MTTAELESLAVSLDEKVPRELRAWFVALVRHRWDLIEPRDAHIAAILRDEVGDIEKRRAQDWHPKERPPHAAHGPGVFWSTCDGCMFEKLGYVPRGIF